MPTFPDGFQVIHLAACDSTSTYLRQHIARLEAQFPLMVSAAGQTAGRGRESRRWASAENLGIYATFGFHLPDSRGLSLLSITSGIAVIDMLERWTGKEFALKWPNDILASGKKIAGVLCETMINGERIICLVGIGVNVNHGAGDFPEALRGRAGSLRLLTGTDWPLERGRERLSASMASWLGILRRRDWSGIIDRARHLSRSFLGRAISLHHQGRRLRGNFSGIAPDGGLRLETADGEMRIVYSGELNDVPGLEEDRDGVTP